MIVLDATTKSLQVVLAAATTSAAGVLFASWADHKAVTKTFTPGSSNGTTNGTTEVTWVAAPGTDVQRQIKYLSLFNADSVSMTVTVMVDVSGTNVVLQRVVLLAGDRLEYTQDGGFRVVSSGGAPRVDSVSPQLSESLKNRIFNGNFDIWQRGTSLPVATGSIFCADRWIKDGNVSQHGVSRQAFTLGQTEVPGNPTYFHRDTVTSVAGASNYAILNQAIEGVRTFAGQTVTVSFYAKADALRAMSIELSQQFGTGGSPSAEVTGIGATKFNLTTAWQKFSVTTTVPSISGKTIGSNGNDCLRLFIWFDAGTAYNSRTNSLGQQSGTFDIAMVQLEEGPIATAFDMRPIGVELALCQRYYTRSNGNNVNTLSDYSGAIIGTVAPDNLNIANMSHRFPHEMRTTPTLRTYNPNNAATNSGRISSVGNAVYNGVNMSPKGILQFTLAVNAVAGNDFLLQYEADAEL